MTIKEDSGLEKTLDTQLDSDAARIRSRIAELKQEPDAEGIKQLALAVNLYYLDSILNADYDSDNSCNKDELIYSLRQRIEGCGFNVGKFAAMRLVRSADEFAREHFLLPYDQDSTRWELNIDAVEDKDHLLYRFIKTFKYDAYIISNMEKALETADVG